jgi:hypothetical protein
MHTSALPWHPARRLTILDDEVIDDQGEALCADAQAHPGQVDGQAGL